jgi:DNA-binding NarL/FixJ family response regulator
MPTSRVVNRQTSQQTVALVAGNRRIADVLGGGGLAVESFDSVDALLDRDRGVAFSAVVVRIGDGVASLTQLVEPLTRRIDLPLVLVCERIDRWEVRTALAAGAAGVVDDAELELALAPCLAATMSGQVCVPRAQSRQVEPPALSAREKQVLGLVVMGYMNSQIAEQLFLAESTVKSHLSSAFGKLGVRSRNEAVSLILDPERGLGMGILALGGERLDPPMAVAP